MSLSMKKLYQRAMEFADLPRDTGGEDLIYPDPHSTAIIISDYLKYVWNSDFEAKTLKHYKYNQHSYTQELKQDMNNTIIKSNPKESK